MYPASCCCSFIYVAAEQDLCCRLDLVLLRTIKHVYSQYRAREKTRRQVYTSSNTCFVNTALSFRSLFLARLSLNLTGKLEDALRALLVKHTADMAAAEATSRKLAKMADLFQQLQAQDDGEGTAVSAAGPHGPALPFLDSGAGKSTR